MISDSRPWKHDLDLSVLKNSVETRSMGTVKQALTAKQALLDLIASDPMGVRDAFSDKALVRALDGIGVVVNAPELGVRALHAPGPGARTNAGVGKTLCGRDRGHRHPAGVTCSYCLKRLGK